MAKGPEALAGGSAKEFKKESTAARLLGAGCAGIAELAVFHPVWRCAIRSICQLQYTDISIA